MKASVIAETIKNSRKGVRIERLGNEGSDDFWKILGGTINDVKTAKEGGDDDNINTDYKVYRFTDQNGKIEFKPIKFDKDITYNLLDTKDVFIIDVGDQSNIFFILIKIII
jgi:hypothetical protein